MKKIESYIDAARNFNSNSKSNSTSQSYKQGKTQLVESRSTLTVVEKPKIYNDSDRGFAEYAFNDGVIVRHSWNGNTYFGHKDYDHSIEVIDNAGYEFEKKVLSYHMQNSREL